MNHAPRSSPAPVLFLVDGNSQMYRAYHAIRGLTGPDGRSTNAVYGFVTMLRKLVADQRPELIACTFDLAGPTFRSSLAADYKANRPAMPADLAEQIAWVHQACEAMGVPIVACPGFEADDVIATVAERAKTEGYDVAIVTGDKDLFQLVGPGVRVFNPRDEGEWFDADGVRERFGVPPEHVVDVLALTGDAIDNIKGVPGIGDKGARSLIGEYGSLDALLERAAEVPQKKYRDALLAHADAARQSRELARLRTDAPCAFEIRALPPPGTGPGGVLRALLRAGLPHAAARVRPHRRNGRARLPPGGHPGGDRRADRRAAGGRHLRAAGDHRARRGRARRARGPGGGGGAAAARGTSRSATTRSTAGRRSRPARRSPR